MKEKWLIVVTLILSVTFSGAIGYTVGFNQGDNEVSKNGLGLSPYNASDLQSLSNGTSDDSINTISVTGVGTAEAEPDIMSLELGVTTDASESFGAEEALAKNSESINAVLEALGNIGISEENIRTSQFNISPRYERKDYGERNDIIGYRVTHLLSVDCNEIDSAGKVIDEAVASGANEIHNGRFSLSKNGSEELNDLARERAAEDARDKAETIASSLGVGIVEVAKVSEGSTYYGEFDRAKSIESGSTQIVSPQTLTETVRLDVTFVIE